MAFNPAAVGTREMFARLAPETVLVGGGSVSRFADFGAAGVSPAIGQSERALLSGQVTLQRASDQPSAIDSPQLFH